jgi:DNA-binding XRE family transcriptional regulator
MGQILDLVYEADIALCYTYLQLNHRLNYLLVRSVLHGDLAGEALAPSRTANQGLPSTVSYLQHQYAARNRYGTFQFNAEGSSGFLLISGTFGSKATKNVKVTKLTNKQNSKLRKIRLEAELSQNKLAARAGLDRRTVSDVENHRSDPQDVTLSKLAKALGTKLGRQVEVADIWEEIE